MQYKHDESTTTATTTATPTTYLGHSEAARFLGIAPGTLYQWVSSNKHGLGRACVKRFGKNSFRLSDLARLQDDAVARWEEGNRERAWCK